MGLFSALLSQDEDSMAERGKEADVDPKVLQFLGHLAMRPSLWALRDLVSEEVDRAQWGQGYCPICGSQPGMAYFSKTGNRYLHCELCGEEWPYPRLQCPFCQNQDQETLGYFHGEQEEGLRVDYCKKCLRYVKTVDQRVFEKATPMEIENLATIHLDLLAEENGFK
jgi:FdhE protein